MDTSDQEMLLVLQKMYVCHNNVMQLPVVYKRVLYPL